MNPTRSSSTPNYHRLLLLIVLLGFALRLGVLYLHDGVRAGFHYQWAQTIAQTGEFVLHDYPVVGVEWRAQRPPGYPIFLALQIHLFGDDLARMGAVQMLLSLGLILAAATLARRWFGDRAALLTALGVALYPYYVFNDLVLHDRLAFNLLLVLGALVATRIPDAGGLRRIAGLGLLLGLTTLVRGSAIGVMGMFMLWLAWSGLRARGWRHGVLRAATLVGAFLLAISPWLARNAMVVGVPTLGTGAGWQYWVGNNPYMIPQGYPQAAAEAGALYWVANLSDQERAELRALPETAFNARFLDLVRDFVRDEPGMALGNLARKAYAFWSPQYSPRFFCEYEPPPGAKLTGDPLCPMRIENPHFTFKSIAHWLSYTPILLLTLWGWRSWWRAPGIAYVGAAVVGLYALHVLTVVESIYRSPLDVFLIVLASQVAIHRFRWRRAADARAMA